MTTLTDEQMERAAIELCILKGWKPEFHQIHAARSLIYLAQQAIATAMKEPT